MPLVSVIIPTFNRANLLPEAVNSILAQTYPDFEIIVVDDGSQDETAATMKAIQDKRLIYLHQDNAGRSAARNKGLQFARGEYIGFLDDDDLYLPDKLTLEVAFLESHPNIDLVASSSEYITRTGEVRGVWRPWKYMPELTFLDVLYRCPFMTCGVLFRRSMLDKLDSWFDVGLEQAEDSDFFIRLALAGCKTGWLEEVLSVYRDHEGRSAAALLISDSCHSKMLDKIFNRADLPDCAKDQQARVRRHFYLFSACRNYSCNWVSAAQRSLLHAWLEQNDSMDPFASAFLERVVRMAGEPIWVSDPVSFISFVFDHLPSSLAWLREHREKALNTFQYGLEVI